MEKLFKAVTIQKSSILLFLISFVGITITSLKYTLPFAKGIFMLSSLALGASLFMYFFIRVEKNSKSEYLFLTLLYLSTIVKVFGIHLKYGIFLGADASAEYTVIKGALSTGFLSTGISGLLASPLSMIYVTVASLFTGIVPVKGVFNLIHLVTSAAIPVVAYILIRNSFNAKIAILSSIVLAYNPPNVFLGLSMTRENFALLFFMLSLVLIVNKLNSIKHIFILVFLLFALVLSHYTTTYFAVLVYFIIFMLIAAYQIKEKKYKKSFYVLFPFAVFALIIYYWLSISPSHSRDIGIAKEYVSSVVNFLTFKIQFSALHYESLWLLKGTSLIEILYKLQGLLIISGCFVLAREIFRRELSRTQTILAIICIPLTFMAILWVVIPALSTSLPPHRALRYTIMLNSLAAGFLLYIIFNLTKVRFKPILTASLIVLYTFPIAGYVADILAFSSEEYPSELQSNMYNVMSLEEIDLMGSINELIPEDSRIIAEFPIARALGMHDGQGRIYKMREGTWVNLSHDSYIIVRKSLFSKGQYIAYPESFVYDSPSVVKFNETELMRVEQRIEKNDVLYAQDNYKLLHVQ
jgi:uncharacterized membrane protein